MEKEINIEDLASLIDFTTLLQLFNMEKKSLVLVVMIGNEKGYIAFKDGEVIDAKLNSLRGIDAFKRMILENPKRFKIVKTNKKIPKTIEVPFMNLLLESVKNVDDVNRENNSKEVKKRKSKGKKKKSVSVEKIFDEKFISALDNIKGFSGCFVVNDKGILVWKYYQFLGDVKFSFSVAHGFVKRVKNKVKEQLSWKTKSIVIYLKTKILFLKGVELNDTFHTLILILDSSSNEAMAKRALAMLDRLLAC